MRFSYKWLKELVDFKESPEELADLINLHITEVETIVNKSANYSGVIVAEILAIEPHPNADKLRLPTLDIGLGKRVQVVCGAPNIEVGQKVPLALVGAVLPGGKLEKTTIRGVESSGMICSAAELGLAEKSDGILVLSKTASVGRPANEFLQLSDDTILDLKVLSNRPDYLSYIGMAREISAVLGKEWSIPIKFDFIADTTKQTRNQVEVIIKDNELCPYYLARYASNLEVKESPDWLKDKLISAGIRPINNLVDISNLVMLETGQPIHMFDAGKIEGKRVVVRRANLEEELLTLAGEKKELTRDILVIADSHRPIALAGIIGGEHSAVSDLTTEVIIESAVFSPSFIRRGSKLLGISTDASLRFERGNSQYLAKLAADRVLSLIYLVIPDAIIAEGIVEVGEDKIRRAGILVNEKKISELLGTKVTKAQITKILHHLGFTVTEVSQELKIVPPHWRLDIKELADIAEEVVRILGIDKIEPAMPCVVMPQPKINLRIEQAEMLKDYLVQCGFSEAPSHNFINEDRANLLGLKLNPNLKLINPLNSNWTHLSSHLWPNLLQFVANHSLDKFKFFEINQTAHALEDGDLPEETLSLNLAVYSGENSYRLTKGIIEEIIKSIPHLKLLAVPTVSADAYINILRIVANNEVVGSIEEIGPLMANKLDIPVGTIIAELNLDELLKLGHVLNGVFKQFSIYPSSVFDLSVEFSTLTSVGSVIEEIYDCSSIIKNVEVFDVYELGGDKRSVGIRVTFQADNKTLVESEIKVVESRVANLITTKYRGKIR